ncbi:hypothetical protein AMS68_002655 [Peltaster fructicola]|uniref:Thioredoxin domain-containing protein n=1 Tax=Peltaster fructicola TaxID=286661 RepID=A0A6H0XR74_9PEZI|nr:hypothetical protein AMS68_002655 [Peltaster fructicola]
MQINQHKGSPTHTPRRRRAHTTSIGEQAPMATPTHVESAQHFSTLLQSSRIVVTDFYADWCGPCKSIAPIYEALSTQLSRPNVITFTKVNVDHQKQIAQMYGITAMPTFMIFKAGRETKRIQGANVKELDAAIKSLAQEAASSGEASSSASGGKGWLGSTIPKGYEDVTDQVDQRGLDLLNLDADGGDAKAIFMTNKPSALTAKAKEADGKDWIESDTDEELMLFIPFQSTMKLHSLHLTSIPPAGEDAEVMRPKTIHLYTNRTTVLGFDEAADTQSTQTIELKESDYDKQTGTAKIELRFVKFQNISSLVIFVANGLGDGEKTRIDRLRLLGEAGEKKSMGKLEKIGNEHGE